MRLKGRIFISMSLILLIFIMFSGNAFGEKMAAEYVMKESVKSDMYVIKETAKSDLYLRPDLIMAIKPTLQVTSTPDGAEVVLSGEYKGDAPRSFFDLEPGSHEVMCALPGYIEQKKEVSVSSDKTTNVSLSLELRPAPTGPAPLDISGKWKGEIQNTGPIEMDIKQDGNKIEGIAIDPSEMETAAIRGFFYANNELEIHFLVSDNELQKFDGFVSESDGKLHMEGTFGRIGATLDKKFSADLTERATATISAKSEPKGAHVLVDGVLMGETPHDILYYPGTHEVTLRLSGYKDYNQTITLEAGSTATVSSTLEPLTGSISLSSNPPGADVFLDGEPAGVVTPTIISGLSPGTHRVTFKLAGYSDQENNETVVAGSESIISVSLIPLGGASVEVTVEVTVEPSRVGPDEPANITVTATGPDGSPLAMADVTVNSSEGGIISIPSGKTDSQGRFESRFIAPSPGNYRITATVTSPISGEASSDAAIEVAPAVSVTPPQPVTPSTPEAKSTPGPGAMAVLVILGTAGSIRAKMRR